MERDYETMTDSYLRHLRDNDEDDDVRAAAEEELARRKDHYEITGQGVDD